MPLLSILTVIKPPAEGMATTLASVEREFGEAGDAEFIVKEWIPDGDDRGEPALAAVEAGAGRLMRRCLRAPDGGVFHGMNQALAAATGDWIVFLNAGDWFADGAAAAFREATTRHPGADYLYFDGVTVDARDGREFLRQAPDTVRLNDFLHRVPILHPCLFVRRTVLVRLGLDPAIDLAADFDLMVRLVAGGYPGRRIPRIGAFIVSGGLSEQRRVRAFRQANRSLRRNAPTLAFRLRLLAAFLRFLLIHTLIVYVIRPLPFLRRRARARTGGQPAGTYSGKTGRLPG
ncbi:MAG: hypothetical protein JJT96_14850 [Opitutales bacterium]|nr:hypothetical protein [Opitutales bacterium]